MSFQRKRKMWVAALATAPAMLAITAKVHAAATWVGSAGNWGDAANWQGTGTLPPNGTGGSNDTFIGNNGTVSLNGGTFQATRVRIGYNYDGATNPGTGALVLDSGTLITDQDSVIGDGAVGTLTISGGLFSLKSSKHMVVGAFSDATINISAGTFFSNGSKYGIENGGGFSTLNLSGGAIQFATSNGPNQINVDQFNFTGGLIQGIRTGTTIHSVNVAANAGTILLDLASSSSEIVFDLASDGTFGGVVGGTFTEGSSPSGTLTKTGVAALTVSNVQSYHRGTNVNGGTLVLDYASSPGDLLFDASTIGFNGGTLRLKAASSGSTSDLIGRFNINAGGSTLVLDKNGGSGLTLDTTGLAASSTIARQVGGVLDIQSVGGTLGTDLVVKTGSGNKNGILNGITVAGAEFAAVDVNGNIIAAPASAYAADTDLGAAASDPTKNLKPTGAQTAVASAVQFNAINLTGSTGISMSGGSITLTSGGIIANTTGSISGGQLTAAPIVNSDTSLGTSDLVVHAVQNITISSDIVGNGQQQVSLTKAGAGVLTISGNNSYDGNTYVDAGTLKLGSSTALPANTTVIASNTPGAALDLNGNNTTVAALNGGGTSGGDVLLSNATLTLNAGGTMNFGGALTGNGGVVKTNGGAATFNNANSSYTGPTLVNGGTLDISSVANGGVNSSIGAASTAAANLVVDGGTVQYVGKTNSSTNRLFTLGANGGTIAVLGSVDTASPRSSNGNGNTGVMDFTNSGAIAMSGSPNNRTLNIYIGNAAIGSSSSAPLYTENQLNMNFSPLIPDSGGSSNPTNLTKSGYGQLTLTALSTFTGTTTINNGTIAISLLPNAGQASPIGEGSLSLGPAPDFGAAALKYTGPANSTNRLFSLNGGTVVIDNSGSGALAFTNSGTIDGTATILFTGDTTGNSFAPILTAGTSVVKTGSGVWALSGDNDYNGPTVLSAGTLVVNKLSNAGAPGSIGAANNGADDQVINGGALQYTGAAASSDRLFSLAASGTLDASGSGAINLTNTGAWDYSLSGSVTTGNRTLGLTGTNTGNNTLSAILSDAGSGSVTSVSKSGTGKWVLSGANNYTGTTTVGGGTLVLAGAAQTPALSGPGNAVINSGALVLDWTGGTDPTPTVQGILLANIGNSNTQGQIRTGHTANANRGIGYKDLGSNQLLLKYAYRGDANLDGAVNALDFNAVASNFGAATGKVWVQGDFNYDGMVNSSDYTYLGQTFGSTPLASDALAPTLGSSLGALVPEPSSLAAIALGAALGLRRRRHRHDAIAK